MRSRNFSVYSLTIVLILLVTVVFVTAQERDPSDVSDDEVNAVAGQMYCPVCEGVPLDDCHTVTCIEWKEEIRQQIASGQSTQQIIDSFVVRFGEVVVGAPTDPTLRALSLMTPLIVAIVVIIGGIWTFSRWQRNRRLEAFPLPAAPPEAANPTHTDDDYRARLEQDLQLRR